VRHVINAGGNMGNGPESSSVMLPQEPDAGPRESQERGFKAPMRISRNAVRVRLGEYYGSLDDCEALMEELPIDCDTDAIMREMWGSDIEVCDRFWDDRDTTEWYFEAYGDERNSRRRAVHHRMGAFRREMGVGTAPPPPPSPTCSRRIERHSLWYTFWSEARTQSYLRIPIALKSHMA
jgi:hypothetical protein